MSSHSGECVASSNTVFVSLNYEAESTGHPFVIDFETSPIAQCVVVEKRYFN